MFILGPIVAAIPFLYLAKATIPSKQDFVQELIVFSAKMYSEKRNCWLCRGVACKRCAASGRLNGKIFGNLNLVRYARKDFYCFAEATNRHGDKFLFKGQFTHWECIGTTPYNSFRLKEVEKMKWHIDGYLSTDAFRLQMVLLCYATLSLYLMIQPPWS